MTDASCIALDFGVCLFRNSTVCNPLLYLMFRDYICKSSMHNTICASITKFCIYSQVHPVWKMKVSTLRIGRDGIYILKIFINNSFKSEMYIITLLLIFSGFAVNSVFEVFAGAKNKLTKAVGHLKNKHLGTPGNKKASKAGYKPIQDLEHDNPKAGLGSSVESKGSTFGNKLEEETPLIHGSESQNIRHGYSKAFSPEFKHPSLRERSFLEKKQAKNGAKDAEKVVKNTQAKNGAKDAGKAVKNTQAKNGAKDAGKAVKNTQAKNEAKNAGKAVKEKKAIKEEEEMKPPTTSEVLGAVAVTSIIAGSVALGHHFKNSSTGSESNLTSGGLVLTPDNAKSSILSNDASGDNSGTPSGNNETSGTTKLPGTPEATHVQRASDSVTKHSRLNTKRAHRFKKKSIMYIVVIVATVLVLIAAGVFVLKMQQVKPKKEDLFTDMNQYYATGVTKTNLTTPIYSNVLLK